MDSHLDVKSEILTHLKSIKRDGINELISYLCKTDFFNAPASTRFHGNYEGGLAEHSLNVYNLLCEKNERFNLDISRESMIITGLLHDICKAGVYKKGCRNVKEGTKINYLGKEVANWIEKEVWEFDDAFPLGHGEKSIIMLQHFIRLEKNEMLMIRWHMGPTDDFCDKRSMYKAFEVCPAALALHTSDFEASRFLEKANE